MTLEHPFNNSQYKYVSLPKAVNPTMIKDSFKKLNRDQSNATPT